MSTIEASRSISSAMASRSASRKLSVRVSDFDMFRHGLEGGSGRLLGELHRVLHDGLRLLVDARDLLGGGNPQRLDAGREDRQRIALHPLLHLVARTVL